MRSGVGRAGYIGRAKRAVCLFDKKGFSVSAKSENRGMLTPRQKRLIKDNVMGYLFIAPQLLGVLVFIVFGIVFVISISFTNWNLYGGLNFDNAKWMGLKNYAYVLNNAYFRHALVTNGFLVLCVPVTIFLSLLLGAFINTRFVFQRALRAVYFLPNVCNMVAIVMLWTALFHPRLSPISAFLESIGATAPSWFATSWNARLLIYFLWLWRGLGYYAFIYLGALNAVPQHLYESALLDGAGKIRQFFSITIPMVSSTTFFFLVTGIISAIKEWTYIKLLTGGNPGGTTNVFGMLAYQNAFPQSGVMQDLGVASSVSVIMLIIAAAISITNWKLQNKWVYYE